MATIEFLSLALLLEAWELLSVFRQPFGTLENANSARNQLPWPIPPSNVDFENWLLDFYDLRTFRFEFPVS